VSAATAQARRRSEAGQGTGEGPRPAASKPRGGTTRCAPSGALPLGGSPRARCR